MTFSSSPSSPDEFILTSSPDGPIMAYEASSGITFTRYTDSQSPCRGLTMVGQELIAVSHVFSDTGAGSIHLYKWNISNVFNNFPLPESVAPLIATSDGDFLFAGGISGTIHSLSLPSGNLIRSFSAHSKPIHSLHLNDDESLVISGSNDGIIVVIATFKLVEEASDSTAENDQKEFILSKWKAHCGPITALKSMIGLCGSTLISCSLDCTCKFWNLPDGVFMSIVAFPYPIFGIVVDSKKSRFYAGGGNGLLYKCSVNVGSKKMQGKDYELESWSESHNGSIVSLALVNKGRNLVSAAEDGTIWMWDVLKGEIIKVFGNNSDKRSMISDMIVTTRTTYNGVQNGNVVVGGGEASGSNSSSFSSRLYDEEVLKDLMQVKELEDVLDVVVQDKKNAINMLESAIKMYEKLLKLILKEAMRAISDGNDGEDAEMEEDKDQEEQEVQNEN